MAEKMTLEQLKLWARNQVILDDVTEREQKAAIAAIDALAQPAQAVDVGAIQEVIDALTQKGVLHAPYVTRAADRLTRALSVQKAGPVGAWPHGCQDANSCARHRACMYARCRHLGEDIGPAIDAASPTPDKEG